MSSDPQSASRLLAEIEGELRQLGLWSDTPPPASALASEMPFCYDTLPLEAWLQWVLLPRFRTLIEAGAPFPPRCEIAPLAEMVFGERGIDAERLLRLIDAFDALVNEAATRLH